MEPLYLHGCRYDILGHYLKAIGLLRVLARCADQDHRDPDAEGWWDMGQACFCLRSEKYPTMEKLAEFFEHYRPTPVFSPWNTGGGMDEKKEIVFTVDPKPWNDYWDKNRNALLAHGFPPPENDMRPPLPNKAFDLKCAEFSLPPIEELTIAVIAGKGKKPKRRIHIAWSEIACHNLFAQMDAKRATLEEGIKFTDAVKKKFVMADSEFVFDARNETVLRNLGPMPGVQIGFRTKTGTKKTIIATLAEELKNDSAAAQALSLGREFFGRFQDDDADQRKLLEEFRDACPTSAAESLDAIFTTRSSSRSANNPLFLNRGMGEGGNDELFRKSWEHYSAFRTGKITSSVKQSLTGVVGDDPGVFKNEIGTPFFPDAQKAYNIGTGWIQSTYPFNALDYVLAAEGAFAMRGTVARTAAAGSKQFAAFPFVFDSCEPLEDGKNVTGTAGVLWFPIWNRATTFEELASFISDAQARLPGKDASFSSELVRALNGQGVDAGFAGWQEFRFKMKGSRVPWVTTGRYVGFSSSSHDGERANATRLNQALIPVDESRFIDQFGLFRKANGKYDKDGPHCVGAAINAAMETAAHEPTPHHCLALLESIFTACRQMCVSESFRKKLNGGKSGGRASFFKSLPMEEWNELLKPLEYQAEFRPEFRIARSLASITGLERQTNGDYSAAQPMLGSLLPVKRGRAGWFLPGKGDRTQQDVWTGSDLTYDLAALLRRRYMDSLKDEHPALRAVHGAKLDDVLTFLRGGLDDRLIARWTEAMSLIGWHFGNVPDDDNAPASADEKDLVEEASVEGDKQPPEMTSEGIEPAYAALRAVLELECEWQGKNRGQWKKRRSLQPFALLCQRSASSLPLAVSEAFRWISIWGVRNPWGAAARAETPRISGRFVVRLDHGNISSTVWDQQLADRVAAAVCIPLRWQDRWQLYRAVTLPPGI
jgi:CRISPR-associated protein Csx17